MRTVRNPSERQEEGPWYGPRNGSIDENGNTKLPRSKKQRTNLQRLPTIMGWQQLSLVSPAQQDAHLSTPFCEGAVGHHSHSSQHTQDHFGLASLSHDIENEQTMTPATFLKQILETRPQWRSEHQSNKSVVTSFVKKANRKRLCHFCHPCPRKTRN